MIEMSGGIGATTMGIGVSHGSSGNEGVTGGCRLRAQGQTTGSASQLGNPVTTQQQQQASSSSQQQQRGNMGRSKRDNCCLCWCCCCSCSCLAAVGGNSSNAGGPSDQGKKKGNSGSIVGEHGVSSVGVGSEMTVSGAGNGLDVDGIDGNVECCSVDEVRSWGSSFEKLMRSPAGRKIFREFLVSEYSEENIAFWLACEQLKCESNPERIEEKARFIYEDYISILSPKEVSLDSRVREIVNRNMVEPTPHTFDEAQLQIYTLMHRDSYPRFVNSDLYRRVARLASKPPSPSTEQEHGSGKAKSKKPTT